jgi:hypothetical protein
MVIADDERSKRTVKGYHLWERRYIVGYLLRRAEEQMSERRGQKKSRGS